MCPIRRVWSSGALVTNASNDTKDIRPRDSYVLCMTQSDGSPTSRRGRPSKVVRLMSEYGLEDLGAELERRWTGEENRDSLRDLAAYFNQQVLRHKLEEADVQLLDGQVENMYRLLTDDVSSAERTRVRRQLEQDGMDVDRLQKEFLTYQAIRTYLKEHRNVEYDTTDSDPVEEAGETVEQLRGRTIAVAEGKLQQLRSNDHLTLGDFRTLVAVEVVCTECNEKFDILDLFDRGGCDCQEP